MQCNAERGLTLLCARRRRFKLLLFTVRPTEKAGRTCVPPSQDTTGTRDAPHRIFITNSKLEQSANLKEAKLSLQHLISAAAASAAWSSTVMEMVRPPPAGFKKCSAFDVGVGVGVPIPFRARA